MALAEWPGGLALRFIPDSPAWWLTRVPWLLVLLTGLALVPRLGGIALIVARPRPGSRPPPFPGVGTA